MSSGPIVLGLTREQLALASAETSSSRMIRVLLRAVFSQEQLLECTLSGRRVKNQPARERLDALKVNAIFELVHERHNECTRGMFNRSVQVALHDIRVKHRPKIPPHIHASLDDE